MRRGTGAGPEALAAGGRMDGLSVSATTTIELDAPAASEIEHCFRVDAAIAQTARRARDTGRLPVVLSGNCHACLGTLSALDRPAAVVWFDAHGDLNTPDTTVTGYFDGMALATAMGWCWNNLAQEMVRYAPVHEDDVILAGGRDLDPAERDRLA
jgi:arginase